MKNPIFFPAKMMAWCLVFAGAVLLSSCSRHSGIEMRSLDGVTVIDLAAPGNQLAQLEKIKQQGELDEPLILKIPAGHRLPVHLSLDAPFAETVNSDNMLVFKQDVFVLVSSTSMAFSPDSQRWATVEDMGALRELFGVSGGQATIEMSARQEQGALLKAGIILRPN